MKKNEFGFVLIEYVMTIAFLTIVVTMFLFYFTSAWENLFLNNDTTVVVKFFEGFIVN